MKNAKFISVVLILVSIISLCLTAVTTSTTISTSKEYQQGLKDYSAVYGESDSLIAKAIAEKKAQEYPKTTYAKELSAKLYKNLAFSLLLLLISLGCIGGAVYLLLQARSDKALKDIIEE